jgi:hypothetical protein
MFSLNDVGFLGSISTYDADALAYIRAVEIADAQELEPGVRDAINAFVVGCKADGIWSAIKASCILAGARTLSGALVPLVGAAPTNFNFVSGDYNRETGLVGNASTKYLDTNTAHSAAPLNNVHLSIYTQNNLIVNSSVPILFYAGSTSGCVTAMGGGGGNANTWLAHDVGGGVPSFVNPTSIGFFAVARNNSANYQYRIGAASITVTRSASTTLPGSGSITIYARSGLFPAACRLAFYSFGESLDLALLDARVTTLVNAFAAAIP